MICAWSSLLLILLLLLTSEHLLEEIELRIGYMTCAQTEQQEKTGAIREHDEWNSRVEMIKQVNVEPLELGVEI